MGEIPLLRTMSLQLSPLLGDTPGEHAPQLGVDQLAGRPKQGSNQSPSEVRISDLTPKQQLHQVLFSPRVARSRPRRMKRNTIVRPNYHSATRAWQPKSLRAGVFRFMGEIPLLRTMSLQLLLSIILNGPTNLQANFLLGRFCFRFFIVSITKSPTLYSWGWWDLLYCLAQAA